MSRRDAAVGWLVASLGSFGVAFGTYRWARSLPGELGFGGVIFLFPIIVGTLAGVGFAWKSLVAWIDSLGTAAPGGEEAGPRRRQPDADAVEALRAHGALPEAASARRAPLKVPKDLAIAAIALAAGLLLRWTDPVSIVRQFAHVLMLFGVVQLGLGFWRMAKASRS